MTNFIVVKHNIKKFGNGLFSLEIDMDIQIEIIFVCVSVTHFIYVYICVHATIHTDINTDMGIKTEVKMVMFFTFCGGEQHTYRETHLRGKLTASSKTKCTPVALTQLRNLASPSPSLRNPPQAPLHPCPPAHKG